MAAHEAVIFAIYMALLGEAIGMFGLTRRGLLAALYYLTLAFISIQQVITTIPPVLLAVTALPVLIFVVIYVTLYSRQAKAREQAQELAAELETANRQLTEYAAQVEDLTIAAERQRMARELHDTLSQGLAGLILQLEAADAHLNQSRPEKARQIIAQSMQKARESLAEPAMPSAIYAKPIWENWEIPYAAKSTVSRPPPASPALSTRNRLLPCPIPSKRQSSAPSAKP